MRIKPLVVLSLVCSLSQAADTVASLGDSIKATQFVTEVDHTRLVNGTTEVIANDNGTASITVSSSIQKENCLRVTRTDGSTGKTIVISFQNTSDELSEWYSTWPSQLYFTVEYDGVIYDAVTVGETDAEDCREISSSLSWLNGSWLWPNGSTSPRYWDGAILGISTPGGLDIIGDGNGESCSTYTYTSSTSSSKTIATTDQIPSTNGLASMQWVNNHKWDWATQVTNAPAFASTDHDHDHLTSDNGEWRLLQMDDGRAVVMPSYYYGEDNGLGVKFMPSIPIEDLHDICSTNATARIPSSMEIELDGSVSSAGYGYTMGSGNTTTFYATNKVSYAEGVVFPDTVQISFDVPFTSGRIYIYNIPILCGSKKTLVTTDYIKSKVQNVNVNLQSAEDTRVALTNLITILKNL